THKDKGTGQALHGHRKNPLDNTTQNADKTHQRSKRQKRQRHYTKTQNRHKTTLQQTKATETSNQTPHPAAHHRQGRSNNCTKSTPIGCPTVYINLRLMA
ncbi:MAG TPA: hypothetical protein V6C97_00005, partial [Oculatellaceae cyanobacterium]